LSIATDSIVTVSNGGVFVSGVKVGSIVVGHNGANGSNLAISLVTGATPNSITTLVEHIAYSNSSLNVSPSTLSVAFTIVDGSGTANGGFEMVVSAAAMSVIAVNHAPTGSVTISGTATEDQTLTASNTLADADGLGAISYQWQRDGSNIGGATGSSYVLGDA